MLTLQSTLCFFFALSYAGMWCGVRGPCSYMVKEVESGAERDTEYTRSVFGLAGSGIVTRALTLPCLVAAYVDPSDGSRIPHRVWRDVSPAVPTWWFASAGSSLPRWRCCWQHKR